MSNKFPKISENLSLNFLNTRVVRNGKTIELINTTNDFNAWVSSELVEKEHKFQLEYLFPYFDSITDISEVISFRDYVYTNINNTLTKKDSFHNLQKWIEKELESQSFFIKFSNNKKVLVPEHKNFEGFKSLIFFHLSTLIESKEIEKLSRCENPECILLFVNKTGRRKWCSMKICGNRSKVERYEQKHK